MHFKSEAKPFTMKCTTTKIILLTLLFVLLRFQGIRSSNPQDQEVDKIEEIILKGIEDATNYESNTVINDIAWDNIQDAGIFDFIVVGTGAAGGVMAHGLAQVNQWKLLVIEAGGERNELIDIPAMNQYLTHSDYNWNYKSEPLSNSGFGRKDRRISIKRGKGLGGTTLVSGLRLARGSKYDWDQMVLDGNPGWSYNNMLPYMKNIENVHLTFEEDFEYRGHNGPIFVEHYNGTIPQMEMMIQAHEEIGHPKVDFNGKSQLGIGHSQLMSARGKRQSTASAFIDPIKNKSNVVISDHSLAIKVIINEKTKLAKGVIYTKNNKLYKAFAKKEVILSGGAINTPQLLMLSGVGPSEELKKHGINVIHDLRQVGQNLIDHPTLDETIYFSTNHTEENQQLREYIQQYVDGYGPLTIAGGIHAISFHKTNYTSRTEGADIAYDFVPPYPLINFEDKEGSVLKPDVYDSLYKNVNFSNAINMQIILLNPKSRGSITLRSSNPFDHPIINLNHFNDPQDMETMLEAIPIISRLENTQAFKNLDAKFVSFHLPACKEFEYRSKEFWKCTIQELGGGGFHPFGTCRMGQSPQNSVVDHKLRVYGIPNLRIIDASVLRKISGYPVSYLFAMSGRLIDIIKAKYLI